MLFDVVENKGFGVMEDPIIEHSRKTFHTIEEALTYLQANRKDINLSWSNWETPYTYLIQSHTDGKLIDTYTKDKLEGLIDLNKIMENIPNNKPLASKEQIDDADTMRTVSTGIKMLINTISVRFPHPKGSREKSLVIAKLQEAIFWADEDIKINHKL